MTCPISLMNPISLLLLPLLDNHHQPKFLQLLSPPTHLHLIKPSHPKPTWQTSSENINTFDQDPSVHTDDVSNYKLTTSFNINSLFWVPMNKIDYICWKSHFQGVLQLHDLKFVLEESMLLIELASGKPNPDHLNWTKANQVILTWICSIVSSSVQTMILHCVSAKDAWALLDRFLSLLCTIHIKSLHAKRRTIRKLPTVTISKFLMDIKAIVDALPMAGSTIQDEEIINYVIVVWIQLTIALLPIYSLIPPQHLMSSTVTSCNKSSQTCPLLRSTNFDSLCRHLTIL